MKKSGFLWTGAWTVLVLAAWNGQASASAATYDTAHPLKVALIVGEVGDKGFFDSAAAGVRRAQAELPAKVTIIETHYKRDTYRATLQRAAADGFDVVIAGTYDYTSFIQELASRYPKVRFIDYDDAPDFATGCCANVLAIRYRVSPAAYLAGYASAKISRSKILGTIIGLDYPVVADFRIGFAQGAKAAEPHVRILDEVAGDFKTPAKGEAAAKRQIDEGADVIFPIASFAGLGALQEVKKRKVFAVGADTDQASYFADNDPLQADTIFTSVEKDVGQSLFLALKATVEGRQEYGREMIMSIREGVVRISKNRQYERIVPAAIRAEIDVLERKMIDGELTVDSTIQ